MSSSSTRPEALRELKQQYFQKCAVRGVEVNASVMELKNEMDADAHPRSLNLENSGLKDTSVLPLFEALVTDNFFTELRLAGNEGITSEAVKVLLALLGNRGFGNIQNLDFSKTSINPQGKQQLQSVLSGAVATKHKISRIVVDQDLSVDEQIALRGANPPVDIFKRARANRILADNPMQNMQNASLIQGNTGARVVDVQRDGGEAPIFQWNLAMNDIAITPYVDPNPQPEPRQVPQIPTPIAQRVQQRRTRTNNPGAPSTDVPSSENSEAGSGPYSRARNRDASDIARLVDVAQEESDISSENGHDEIVDLSSSRCVEVPPNVLQRTDVKGLILTNNKIGPNVQLSPELLRHLVLLDLEANDIDTFPDISTCDALRLLNLDHNRIRKFESLNARLVELRIANNELKTLTGVANFPRLARLDIRG